ncbi:serine hydrolase domain-containing protein [Winogradskyella luteola]|uniref:Serine hydrolase n=1 Tax=Winogradskyella luteola TaxID=2828330 RepID=A0A9X1F914_9FLAO|nr:serine hydrolase domain-containing protein [Winogradskyella luteola]MBV7268813.1 serine hydrolase [Winogradskyella luteola]
MKVRFINMTTTLFVKNTFILLLCINFSNCQESREKKIEKIDQLLSDLNSNEQFNGGFMIGDRDVMLFEKVYGYADMKTKKPLDVTNSFGIASVNKTITATLIMKMVELEYFTVNNKLVDFFPKLPYTDITIDHLLTHTSGIPFYYDNLVKKHWDKFKQLTNNDLFKLYEEHQPKQEFPAGEKFSYSNAGYMFLAGIAERASKKTYDDLLRELIFEPANMKHTQRLTNINDDTNLAKPHALSLQEGAYVPLDFHEGYPDYLDSYFRDRKGAGGLNSTFTDLWKFSNALQTAKIIEGVAIKKMLSPAKTKDGKQNMYARGWQLEMINGKRNIGHRGGSEGENCFFRIALDENYTYFLIANAKTPYLSKINNQIKNILQGNPIEKVKISGVERLSLLYEKNDYETIASEAKKLSAQKDDYYFELVEFNNISWQYWQQENFEKAFDFLKLATVAMPNNAGAWEVLAEAYMERGKNEQAIKYYKLTIDKLNTDETKKDKKWVTEWIVEIQNKIEKMEESKKNKSIEKRD